MLELLRQRLARLRHSLTRDHLIGGLSLSRIVVEKYWVKYQPDVAAKPGAFVAEEGLESV
jgi:hypothetical protein